jgi:hypothetical protein
MPFSINTSCLSDILSPDITLFSDVGIGMAMHPYKKIKTDKKANSIIFAVIIRLTYAIFVSTYLVSI